MSLGDIVQGVPASGTLEAVTTVQVGTQVSGTATEPLADFNDIVRKGQAPARSDARRAAQSAQTDAGLVRATRRRDQAARLGGGRQAQLRAGDGILSEPSGLTAAVDLQAATYDVRTSEAQLRSGDAQVTQARASVHQSRVNLDHTVITSPIDGVVIARNVDAGQTVAASMSAPTLFVLAADLTRMRVNAKLDESDIGQIAPGMTVTF